MKFIRAHRFFDTFFLTSIFFILFCASPQNPSAPQNTRVIPLVKNMYNIIEEKVGSDSLGNTISVGAALNLPENIDSIFLEISSDGETIYDTMITDIDRSASTDTVWIKYLFHTEGSKTATFTPYSSVVDLSTVTATIVILPKPDLPENHPPVIQVSGNRIAEPGETVSLTITAEDPDKNQNLNIRLNDKPENSTFEDDTFSWTSPNDFIGTVTLLFTATDDGFPPETDSEYVEVVITETPHPPVLQIDGKRIVKPSEVCTLVFTITDEDEEQEHAITMSGNPDDAGIESDSLFIWSVPENSPEEDYTIIFTVTDDGTPPLSGSAEVVITVSAEGVTENYPPKWNTDTLPVQIEDNQSYALNLDNICSDINDDELTFTLLSGTPDDDGIEDGEYRFDPSDTDEGTYYVHIVAEDTEDAADTLVIQLTVPGKPATGLKSVSLSVGTLKEQSAPVPDTIYDTVSYLDSVVTVAASAFNATSEVTVNGEAITADNTSENIAVDVGNNTVTIIVKAENDSESETHTVIIVRKPDSTIPLENPPEEVNATALSETAIEITWKDLYGANRYTIQRSNEEDGASTEIGTSTDNSFTDTSLDDGTTFYYRVKASNSAGGTEYSEVTNATTWLAPSISEQPSPQSVTEGTTAEFSVEAQGIPAPSYQWECDGETITDATSATYITGTLDVFHDGSKYRCVVTNSAGSVTSDEVTLTVSSLVIGPEILTISGDTTVTAGIDLQLSVTCSGTSPQIQWRKDGEIIDGADQTTLSLSSIDADDAGAYSVKAWNSADSAISESFTVTVLPNAASGVAAHTRTATSIEVTWESTTGATGYNVLRAEGGGDFESIVTVTALSLVDTPLTEGTSYSYRIIAENGSGSSDTSDAVSATTWSGPAINDQPEDKNLIEGNDLQLNVTAEGNPAVSYQWYKDDLPIASETQHSYSRNNVTEADSGQYYVIVTNAVRELKSDEVTVTVRATYTLATSQIPTTGGSVSRYPVKSLYLKNEDVEVTASPAPGYRFNGWTGDITATGNPYVLSMSGNTSITANFIRQYTLSVNSTSNGGATPTSPQTVDNGTYVNITASPNNGYEFDRWNITSGAGNVTFDDATDQNTRVRVNGDATIQAAFKLREYTVSFNTHGGTGVPDETVNHGNQITEPTSTLSGLTLVGWFTESGYETLWDFSDAVTGSMTLHAKWEVRDRDGNVYDTVRIGNQTWMVQNLKTTRFNDGTTIQNVPDSADWFNLTSAAYCWPNYDASVGSIYGALYNHFTARREDIAPSGWHVPSYDEWQILLTYCNNNGINLVESSFQTVAGGFIRDLNGFVKWEDDRPSWWSTTGLAAQWYFAPGPMGGSWYTDQINGLPIRCIKD